MFFRIMTVFICLFLLNAHPLQAKAADEVTISDDMHMVVPIEAMKCSTDADCVIVSGVCDMEWRALNKDYEEQAKQAVKMRNAAASCVMFGGVKMPLFGCNNATFCEIRPAADDCLLRDHQGNCQSYCTIRDDEGFCQHACAGDEPCD